MNFKIGDKVILTSRIFENVHLCDGNCANEAMKGSVGKIFTIKNLGKAHRGGCGISLKNSHWSWCLYWFDACDNKYLEEELFEI